jgi:hypothetical protein
MHARGWISVFVTVLVGCQTAGGNEKAKADPRPAPADTATNETERLLAEPPDGWVAVFANKRPGVRMAEYVPAGESGQEWSEKVSFESFGGEPLPDPIGMLVEIARDQSETCNGFADNNTFSGYENGYPTSVRLFVCRNNAVTQKGQITLVKAIQGQTQLYVVTRARRVPPIESDAMLPMAHEDMADWSTYMRAISLCDTADSRHHPCPSTAEPSAKQAEPSAKQAEPSTRE